MLSEIPIDPPLAWIKRVTIEAESLELLWMRASWSRHTYIGGLDNVVSESGVALNLWERV